MVHLLIEVAPRLEAFTRFWQADEAYLRRQVALFPPTSKLEEMVFRVQTPAFRELYRPSTPHL